MILMIDDYDKKYEKLQAIQSQMPQYFDQPEHISKHLLDVSDYPTVAINHDLARANLNPKENREIYANGSLILEIEEAEIMCGFDLSQQKAKTMGSMGLRAVTSRSKGGWGSMLSKTDKHVNINQMEQFSEEVNDQFNPEVAQQIKPSFLDRFRRRV